MDPADLNNHASGYGGNAQFGFSETGLYTSADINAAGDAPEEEISSGGNFELNSGEGFGSYNQLSGYTPSPGSPSPQSALPSGANFELNSGANFSLNSGANFGNLPSIMPYPATGQEENIHAVETMMPPVAQVNLTAITPANKYPKASGMGA